MFIFVEIYKLIKSRERKKWFFSSQSTWKNGKFVSVDRILLKVGSTRKFSS